MTNRFPDFDVAVQQHCTDLQAIWDDYNDPIVMLELMRESNYSQHYFPELVEFLRWLWRERQINGDNIGDFDAWLSKVQVAKGTDGQQFTPAQLHEIVLLNARESINKLTGAERSAAVWDAAVASVGMNHSQTGEAPERESQRKLEIATKLRILIPAPFLPKVS